MSFTAGGFLLIQPFIMTIVSPKAGALSDKFSSRLIASLGMGMMMIGLFAFSFLDKDTSFYLIGINLAFIGLGFGLFASPNNNAIMGAVEAKFYGVGVFDFGSNAPYRASDKHVISNIAIIYFYC